MAKAWETQAPRSHEQPKPSQIGFYRILRNRCFKLVSTRNRNDPRETEEQLLLVPAPGKAPEETMALERALLSLSAEQRELITLKHLDGLSYEELG